MEDLNNKETLFTKIIKREIPSEILFEDENHLVFLDIFPFEKGHTLVIPKKPYETILEMPENEFLELMKIVKKTAEHLEKKMNCGINIMQNNKKISGQEINHVHFQVIPRTKTKKLYCIENIEKYAENEIKEFREKLKFN